MIRLLASCKVRLAILHKDDLALDESERLRQTTETLRPNAILVIRSRGGVFQSNNDWHHVTFSFALIEPGSHYTLWGGEAEVTAETIGGESDGRRFAAEIITHLRDDGVLTSCPSGELSRSSPLGARGVPEGARKVAAHP
jgi:hypothetical protein